MSLRKSINTKIILVQICLLLLGGSTFAAKGEVLDRVVAKVNDEIITLSGLEERLTAEVNRYRQAGMLDKLPKEGLEEMMLDRMVDEKLQIQDGKKLGMSVEEEQIMKALDDIKRSNKIDDYQLEEMLSKESTTMEQYKETIRKQILVSKVVGFQVKNRTKVSEKEVRDYFRKHRKDFSLSPKVKARHILFILDEGLTKEQKDQKKQTAAQVKQMLDNGEKFEELAKKYSEDVSASEGGDLGYLERGKMVIDLENVIFSLKAGEVSDLVRTPYGIHIVKVDAVKPGGTKPFEEVRPEIENVLKSKKFQTNYESYMRDLRKSAFIEKLLDGKKPPEKKRRSRLARRGPQKEKLPPLKNRKSSGVRPGKSSGSQKKKIDPDSIFAPLTVSVKGKSAAQHQVAEKVEKKSKPVSKSKSRFAKVQRELKRIKKMRDDNIISEADYQKKKKQLLSKL
ncbi:MAG: hypothetical protein G3M70_16845 [Candidatus Nitronauta litoralis]|uniref:PpiC domain-containing protein n=1 Tax=Candidatus Nitronauta litoralis TaxID=2705533 RepID=A0A7T0BYT7_9BACT|nr:MAG: hypothetical protein G3M70_16845 [Candidatus Nitronauta litoralis]